MKSLQNISYKTLFTILFLSLAGIVFFLRIGKPANKVSAAWWDEMWHYRKAINITNSSGSNLTDFQVSISVGTSQLIADGKMQTDCDDLRITDINGNLLSYWIEPTGPNSCNQTADTKVWVKANSLPTSGATVYVYYGNSQAASVSSGTDTFIYFKNNFQTSDLGWNWSNGGVESGWAKTWATGADNPGSTMTWLKNIINITGQEVVVEFTVKATKSGSTGHDTTNVLFNPTQTTTLYNNTNSSTIANGSGNSIITFGNYSGWYGKVGFDATTGQASNITNDTTYPTYQFNTDGWVRHVHKLTNSSLLLSGYSLGGLSVGTSDWTYNEKTITSGYTKPNNIILAIGEQYYESIWLREAFIRKYTSTEPTVSLQSEELSPAPIAYWKFDEGVGATAYDSTGTNHGTISGATWISENQCISEKCLSFDDTQNNYVLSSSTIPISSSQTYSVWVKPVTTSSLVGILTTHNYADTSNIGINITGGKFAISIGYTDGTREYDLKRSNFTIPTNKWTHVGLIYNHTENSVSFYINGKFDNKWILNKTVKFLAKNILVGQWSNNFLESYKYNGLIDEPKIYPYARTADQIKQDYNSRGSMSGSSVNLGVQSNTAPPLKSSLVAYWKFDENSGTTAYDSSGNNLNGTFGTGSSAPTWTQGKNKQALNFNGTTNYVSTPYIPNISSNQLTISTWIKPNSIAGVQDISNQNQWDGGPWTGWRFQLTNGNITFKLGDGTSTPYLYSAGTISANTWQHIVGVWDGSYIYIYVNGKEVGKSAKSFTYSGNTSTHFIGKYPGTAYFFNGLIDEVKIYNRAITPEEVKQDYNAGSAIQFGSISQSIGGTTTSLDYCIPGDTSYCASPVAEWNFEENTGTTAKDTSGNNNNGTIGVGSSAPTWSLGQNNKGAGLKFDGVSNRLPLNSSINLNSNANWTVSAWVKTNSAGANPVLSNKDSGPVYNDLRIYNSKISYYHYNGAWINETGNINVANGQWNYLTWVNHNNQTMDMYVNGIADTLSVNSALSTAGPVNQIGRDWAVTANATIDDVKIYNYARTPAQIAYDYNKGAPIGWWKFDECQGSIAYDSSGVGNTGVIVIGSSGSQNSIGTCQIGTSAAWTNGASGKINSSLNFDGVDDYITYGNPNALQFGTNDFSISLFTYRTANGLQGGSYFSSGNYMSAGFDCYDNNFRVRTSTGALASVSFSATLNKWEHHVFVVTQNSTPYIKHYINGVLNNSGYSGAGSLGTFNSTFNFRIGISNAGGVDRFFNGQIDDVRIYNYALTSEQVKQVYNGGAVNFQ